MHNPAAAIDNASRSLVSAASGCGIAGAANS